MPIAPPVVVAIGVVPRSESEPETEVMLTPVFSFIAFRQSHTRAQSERRGEKQGWQFVLEHNHLLLLLIVRCAPSPLVAFASSYCQAETYLHAWDCFTAALLDNLLQRLDRRPG
jgi:hypothetical protein